MRRISASYVYPISSPPVKYGIVVLDQQFFVTEMINSGGVPVEISSLEYYNGIILPGFIRINFLSGLSEDSQENNRLSFESGLRATVGISEKSTGESDGKKPLLRILESKNAENKVQELDSLELIDDDEIKLFSAEKPIFWKRAGSQFIVRLNENIIQNYRKLKEFPVWFVVSPETIDIIERDELVMFFKENLNRIVFSWQTNKPDDLWKIVNFFLEPACGLCLNDMMQPLTINPAKMIGMSESLGQIKTGFHPGINLIEGIDFKKMIPVLGNIRIKRLA